MFFSIDELIVKDSDNVSSLLEHRAHLFFSRSNEIPTTVFISKEYYTYYLAELSYINRYSLLAKNISTHITFNSAYGNLQLKVIEEAKNFLLVGTKNTYADLTFNYGLPIEFWYDSARKKADEEFERIILNQEV